MPKAKADKENFATLMKELEDIVAWFEREDVELDESLAKFERGVELSKLLKAKLKQAENKVKKIKANLGE